MRRGGQARVACMGSRVEMDRIGGEEDEAGGGGVRMGQHATLHVPVAANVTLDLVP